MLKLSVINRWGTHCRNTVSPLLLFHGVLIPFYASGSYIWNRNSEEIRSCVCRVVAWLMADNVTTCISTCAGFFTSQSSPPSSCRCNRSSALTDSVRHPSSARVVESAGQQVLSTGPASAHTFCSCSAFRWLRRCCFHHGNTDHSQQ